MDPRRVVHETIDGETVVIDLESGTYFSLTGSGPQIWCLLMDGWSDVGAIDELRRGHAADGDAIASATAEIIEQLERERLIEEQEPDRVEAPAEARSAPVNGPFEPPVLKRYTDMEYLLLLDPIHEVADAGWPHTADTEQTTASSG